MKRFELRFGNGRNAGLDPCLGCTGDHLIRVIAARSFGIGIRDPGCVRLLLTALAARQLLGALLLARLFFLPLLKRR